MCHLWGKKVTTYHHDWIDGGFPWFFSNTFSPLFPLYCSCSSCVARSVVSRFLLSPPDTFRSVCTALNTLNTNTLPHCTPVQKTESKCNTKRIHWLQIQCFGLYYTPLAPNHLIWFSAADTFVKEYESIQGAFKNHSAPIILSYMQHLVVHDVGQVVTVLFCRQTVPYALLYFCCYCVFVFFWCYVSRHV